MSGPARGAAPGAGLLPRLAGALLFGALFFGLAGTPGDAAVPPGGAAPNGAGPEGYGLSHAGNLLVAASGTRDPRFQKTVILMIRHDEKGAFGLIINRAIGRVKAAALYKQLKIAPPPDPGEVAIHYGGPVSPGAGFVVHSTETGITPEFTVGDQIGVSPTARVLRAISRGYRPRRAIFMAGYSGWGAGQLEGEIDRGSWHTAPADIDIVFDEKLDTKWSRAKSRRVRSL